MLLHGQINLEQQGQTLFQGCNGELLAGGPDW